MRGVAYSARNVSRCAEGRWVKHIRELIKAKKADGKLIDEVAVKLCSLYVLGDDRNESSSC